MLVELGNVAPKGVDHSDPCVTYVNVPDDRTFDPNVDLAALKDHLYNAVVSGNGITQRPNDEALLDIVHPTAGAWGAHSDSKPSWVASDKPEFATTLAAWFGCPVGAPANVEDTHWTKSGPPGVNLTGAIQALVVNSGNDIISQALGGGVVGATGTATSTSATSLTNTGASWTTNAFAKCVVVALSSGVIGIVESNTSTVLTIDQWYTASNMGGGAASTPSGTTAYVILSGTVAAWFIGLSSSNSSPSATDTTLGSEITTSGGGLIRKLTTYAHTASATTYTLTATWTANGTDSLPVTIYRSATFISAVSGWSGSMMTEDTLNASATITASGDQLTLTFTATV